MNNIKLIVSEVEGVITKGSSALDELGNTLFKDYYIADFEAINKLKEQGYIVVFISTDNTISYNLFRRKNIPFYWAKTDKLAILSSILMRYNVSADETIYIGSKLSDIPCMRMIPTSFCTNPFLGFDKFISKGGEGVLTELYLILSRRTDVN